MPLCGGARPRRQLDRQRCTRTDRRNFSRSRGSYEIRETGKWTISPADILSAGNTDPAQRRSVCCATQWKGSACRCGGLIGRYSCTEVSNRFIFLRRRGLLRSTPAPSFLGWAENSLSGSYLQNSYKIPISFPADPSRTFMPFSAIFRPNSCTGACVLAPPSSGCSQEIASVEGTKAEAP